MRSSPSAGDGRRGISALRSQTQRRKMVLEQMMLGLSNKVIARKLNLTVGTIKTLVKSILAKLDADSRTGTVIAAQHRGLLS